MKKENLVKAAKNLNKVLFEDDDPQRINVKADAPKLKSEIKKAALILEESDELEENTVAVLSELLDPADLKKGVVTTLKKLTVWADAEDEETEEEDEEEETEEEETEDEEDEDEEDEDEEDEEDEDEEDEEPSLEDQIEDATTTKELNKIAKSDPRFAHLKGQTFKTMKAMKAALIDALENPPAEKEEEEEAPAKKKGGAKEKKEKVKKGPSAYGTTVQLMCKKPTMNMAALIKAVEKKGIDPVASKGAINTGYNAVKKVYTLLKENGFITE